MTKSSQIGAAQQHEWIAGLRAERLELFRELFEAYTPRLCRFAALSVPADVAEDIVQDVLFDVWQRRKVIEVPDGRFSAYLFGAVRNRAWQYLRHQRVVAKMTESSIDDLPIVVGGRPADPAEIAVAHDLEEALALAMEQLSELQRAVITLRWANGMSYPEIAEALSLSANAAMLHGSRARQALRPYLERFFEE